MITVAYTSEQGRRENNEDMFAIPCQLTQADLGKRGFSIPCNDTRLIERKGYLFALADGVGGNHGGEVASEIAIREVQARYYRDPSCNLATSLSRIIEATNRTIWKQRQQDIEISSMATTLVAVALCQQRAIVANVGDSRVYHLAKNKLSLLTHDHSWIQEQIDKGTLTHEQARRSAHRNRVTRCLGKSAQVGVDVWEVDVAKGDRLLLCSDGLSDYIDNDTLNRLCRTSNIQRSVSKLIDTAYENGSSDNISIVLLELSTLDENRISACKAKS